MYIACLVAVNQITVVTVRIVTVSIVTVPIITVPIITVPIVTVPIITVPIVTVPIVTKLAFAGQRFLKKLSTECCGDPAKCLVTDTRIQRHEHGQSPQRV
jgi:hypothetical protein